MTVSPSDLSHLTHKQMFFKNETAAWWDCLLYIRSWRRRKVVTESLVFIIRSVMISINHPLVSRVECLRKKPWYLYRNVFPLIPFYIIAISSFWKVEQIQSLSFMCWLFWCVFGPSGTAFMWDTSGFVTRMSGEWIGAIAGKCRFCVCGGCAELWKLCNLWFTQTSPGRRATRGCEH